MAEFDTLFVNELGWDRTAGIADLSFEAGTIRPVAEKRGVTVWHCPSIPDARARQKLDRDISRRSAERLLIFGDAEHQLWLWPERRASGGTRLVSHEHRVGQANPALEQRLERIRFALAEEDALTPLEVRQRVRTAFNADKITQKFYKEVSEQRMVLSQAITGLEEEDRQLYASILLDRLMFLYFIQQKGFLNADREYLSHCLQQVRDLRGQDRFYEFYRDFLVPLFHQGLGSSKPTYDDPVIQKIVGNVPYVNGGIFSEIPLERQAAIHVPDAAFEKIFALFNRYRWHLDERPTGEENEINPEVLGYILEQYINQKDQGAYYTADDITGYMAGLAVSGHFLDVMDDVSMWDLLRQNPDRYIPEAMRHGSESPRFAPPISPADWTSTEWDQMATVEEGLPTETRREAADRILQYKRLCKDAGKSIASVNAATTANLDLTQLAIDWLTEQTSPKTLLKVWQTLTTLRVLDPTCGSGAFLLAAMKVLQDLYEATFAAIQEHVNNSSGKPDPVLAALVAEANEHPSPPYYLRKTIALHNLYGVDIMPEAVEIARLRLFLALVATADQRDQLEPLPDLDMNIRCGNILVGCLSADELRELHAGDMIVEEQIAAIEKATVVLRASYQQFQEAQRQEMGDGIATFKVRLQCQTEILQDKLNRLYSKAENQKSDWEFQEWRESHKPFHWIAEFPEAMLEGGFSVVLGNPPFVRKAKVTSALYQFEGFETDGAPDIYAPCMERSADLLEPQGRFAMLSPISLVSGLKFDVLRNALAKRLPFRWVTVFDLIPGHLFKAKVCPALTLGSATGGGCLSTSNLRRWRPEYRPYLFATTHFASSEPVEEMRNVWPLIGDEQASAMLQELRRTGKQIGDFISIYGRYRVGRRMVRNRRFLTIFLSEPPCWRRTSSQPGHRIPQTAVSWIGFDCELHQQACFLIFAGRLGHLLWASVGDSFHVTDNMLKWFPCDLDRLTPVSAQIARLAEQLDQAQMDAPMVDRNKNFIGGYDIAKCRHITDEADQLIMAQLGVEQYWPFVLLLDNRIVKSRQGGAKTDYAWLKPWTPTRGPWDPSMPA